MSMPGMTHGTVPSTFKAFDYDTCLLGIYNGTLPDGRHGNGTYTKYGVYAPTSTEKSACLNAHESYAGSIRYAHWTIIFITVFIGVFTLNHALEKYDRYRRNKKQTPPFILHSLLKARARRWAYLRGTVFGISTPTLGVSIILLGFFAFSNILTWGIRPYYRPHNFGSPPLGLRSEWVATAMIPFIYALATKRNFIQVFTGIPYATLMVFHQWSAQILLFFSFVHTVAMIIRVTPIEPWSYTLSHRTTYWTGFAALAQLFALCILSYGPIRRFAYETFYWSHMFFSLSFLAFMFPHCLDGWVLPTTGPLSMLDSWAYLWAATAIWFTSVLWRVGAIVWQTRCFTRVSRAALTILPDNALRITVRSTIPHSAGQHFFLRFPTLEPFGSHPFTVARAPPPRSSGTTETVEFVIRPAKGITSRLFNVARKGRTNELPIVLDGPYGGEQVASLSVCDTVILFAGGSGMSAVAPVAVALSQITKENSKQAAAEGPESTTAALCKHIVVVWAARRQDAFHWFEEALNEARANSSGVSIRLHVTTAAEDGDDVSEKAKSTSSTSSIEEGKPAVPAATTFGKVSLGRPDVATIVADMADATYGRMGVLVCGPESLCNDVREAVVVQQRLILDGNGYHSIEECELHEESFAY